MMDQRPASSFTWIPEPWGRALYSPEFAAVAPHFFTTRDVSLRGSGADGGWEHVARSAGVGPDRLVRLKQVHAVACLVLHPGDEIPVCEGDDGRPRADIVMTDDPAIAITVQVADCVPLLLADPVRGAVAAVHGGWRGTAAGVARVAVSAMATHFATRAADLLALIGPSIGRCCYQVGSDVLEAFRAAGFADEDLRSWFHPDAAPPAGQSARYRLDVPAAIASQLRAAGLQAAHIAACGLCTACNPSLFPSYRRDGAGTGRIAAVIRRS